MLIHTATGTKLISGATAIEIARLVTLDRFGKTEVERNIPLKVTEDGNAWTVTGTFSNDFNQNNPPDPSWHGPLRMVISSLDGQILSYTFIPNLPWMKNPGAKDKG